MKTKKQSLYNNFLYKLRLSNVEKIILTAETKWAQQFWQSVKEKLVATKDK